MKKLLTITCLLSGFLFIVSFQKNDPWKPQQLIQPSDLALVMNDASLKQPLIINVGPAGQIRSAISVGSASAKEGMEKFKKEIAPLDKNKNIVIYCGCCTSENCPNIRPAFEYLNKAGYTNHKLLVIETSLQRDWIDRGYPMRDSR